MMNRDRGEETVEAKERRAEPLAARLERRLNDVENDIDILRRFLDQHTDGEFYDFCDGEIMARLCKAAKPLSIANTPEGVGVDGNCTCGVVGVDVRVGCKLRGV